jgi:Tannase-like family of unknown function (DUF6351)
VTGLDLGANTLSARSNGHGKGRPRARLTLVNHPVTGPIFSGPQQQPFVCKTQTQGLGFPKVDNQDGIGMRLFQMPGDPTTELIGWSKDCTVDSVVNFAHRTTSRQFRPLPPGALPPDIATTTTLDGRTVPYVVRRERGTINRFIYGISILSPLAIVLAGTTASSPPFTSATCGRQTRRLRGTVGAPEVPLADATGTVADPGGTVATPNGTSPGAGGGDAVLVRIAP